MAALTITLVIKRKIARAALLTLLTVIFSTLTLSSQRDELLAVQDNKPVISHTLRPRPGATTRKVQHRRCHCRHLQQ
jgi:hypothetical protein